jgi:hypothetical protein
MPVWWLLRKDSGDLVFLRRPSSRYVAERWLRAAGDPRLPGDRSLVEGRHCDPHACVAQSSVLSVALVEHPAAFAEECGRVDVLVARVEIPEWCREQTPLAIGPREAEAHGAVSVRVTGRGKLVESVGQRTTGRPWGRRDPAVAIANF